MRKRGKVLIAGVVLSLGLLAAPASAGQYCERADDVGAGGACRTVGGAAIAACNKVAGIWGNECGLG